MQHKQRQESYSLGCQERQETRRIRLGQSKWSEIFVSSFASVFSSSNAVPLPHQECRARLQEVDVSLEEISVLLSRLDVSSSMGPDGVHPRLLKSCPAIAQPLYLIFNNSLRSGRYLMLRSNSICGTKDFLMHANTVRLGHYLTGRMIR